MTISLEDFWDELPNQIALKDPEAMALFLDDYRGLWPSIQEDVRKNASLAYVLCLAVRIRNRAGNDIHAQNEADAQALGYPNLISMQMEKAGEQHPEIVYGAQARSSRSPTEDGPF